MGIAPLPQNPTVWRPWLPNVSAIPVTNLLVDSDILIDFTRGIDEARDFLAGVWSIHEVGISCITQMELFVGARDKAEQRRIEQFLTQFEIVSISDAISTVAVGLIQKYHLSHGLAIPDALIAATVLHLDVPLVTKNVRDFKFIKGLRLTAYP